jgi:hypothetical protein
VKMAKKTSMTRQEFLGFLEENSRRGLELIKLKNQDYAGDTDPFRNFRFSELIGLPVDQAIMMRMTDKMARISNLLRRDAACVDEKVTDTLLDLQNYANILLVFLLHEKK